MVGPRTGTAGGRSGMNPLAMVAIIGILSAVVAGVMLSKAADHVLDGWGFGDDE